MFLYKVIYVIRQSFVSNFHSNLCKYPSKLVKMCKKSPNKLYLYRLIPAGLTRHRQSYDV